MHSALGCIHGGPPLALCTLPVISTNPQKYEYVDVLYGGCNLV